MQGTWTTLTVGGKPAEAYEPPVRPRFGVLHLHDLDAELRLSATYTQMFDELRLACVCPFGARSWWADRVCLEFDPHQTAERHLLENVVPLFAERWGLRPRSLGLQGVGMGGQGALRLAFKRPDLFPVVAALAPAVDYHDWYGRGTPLDDMYDSKEQCRQDTATLHIHPSQYPPKLYFAVEPTHRDWYRGCDRLHEKLNALGIAHMAELARGAENVERLERFVSAGLDQESRRLL